MIRFFSFLYCLALLFTANAQSNYSEAIKQGDNAFDRQRYRDAINKYFAAEAFDPTKKSVVKEKVNRTFKKIEDLRAEAENAKKKAEISLRETFIANSQRMKAEYERQQTQKDKDELHKNLEVIKNTNKVLARKLYGLSDDADPTTKAVLLEVQNILDGKISLIDTPQNIAAKITITVDHLKAIAGKYTALMPGLAEWMNKTCPNYGINSVGAYAHFLAQACYETANFSRMLEYGNGAMYEGRISLGNTNAGDGAKYKGRGIVFTTGRTNYLQLGLIKGDRDLFLNKPELLETPEYAVWAACEFWKSMGLIKIANLPDDTKEIKKSATEDVIIVSPLRYITRRISGGFNGLETREKYFNIAKTVLGH